jgi:phosphatidylinositol glycan class T
VDPVTKNTKQVVSNTVLLTLPTPDFTMPFNVIMLTSMVLTVFYGQFFNFIFRRFYVIDPAVPHTLGGKARQAVGKLKGLVLAKLKRK